MRLSLAAQVNALSAAEASGGEAASAARKAEVAISSQLLEAQATLKARNEELLASQADGRRHAAAAELSRQEKGVLAEAQARLARELAGSQESKVELRHLLESLQQMQAGWQQTEAAARAQLLGDKEAADREWVSTKALLARERERGAEARHEADQAAAAARQQLQDVQAEAAAALEKVWRPAPAPHPCRLDWPHLPVALLPLRPSSPAGVAWAILGRRCVALPTLRPQCATVHYSARLYSTRLLACVYADHSLLTMATDHPLRSPRRRSCRGPWTPPRSS